MIPGVDEVREGLLAADDDNRNALAVPSLELPVAADVNLLELERDLAAYLFEHPAGALAEVAAVSRVERDFNSVPTGHALRLLRGCKPSPCVVLGRARTSPSTSATCVLAWLGFRGARSAAT